MFRNARAITAAAVLPLALVACSSNKTAEPVQPSPAHPGTPSTPPSAPSPAPTKTTPPVPSNPSAHAAHAADDSPGVSRTGLRIRFGIMPGNYDDDQDGIDVADVYGGTSAADAGIKPGDRLMTWNGKKIVDVQNWMEHMAPHKPGDVVDVGVLRDGKIIPIKVTLKAG